jgi:2-phospho-L-lactate guanylyltransferase (CobY/MobA/RfbA family)
MDYAKLTAMLCDIMNSYSKLDANARLCNDASGEVKSAYHTVTKDSHEQLAKHVQNMIKELEDSFVRCSVLISN